MTDRLFRIDEFTVVVNTVLNFFQFIVLIAIWMELRDLVTMIRAEFEHWRTSWHAPVASTFPPPGARSDVKNPAVTKEW